MNQYQKRKCLKGEQHQNRDIQALCLEQTCNNDRLLCFYCIHKNHQNHQIIYLLQGLDSPIEKLNINSQIPNKINHQKFLQRKIKKINQGWKNLYRLFETYINKIEINLQPQLAIIQESFHKDAAKKFAEVITNANTPQQVLNNHVQKIKLIMKYDLSDIDNIKVSTAVAYQQLKQMYTSANTQIHSIMSKILHQTNIFSTMDYNLSSFPHKNRGKLGIDLTNRVNISIESDTIVVDSFENRSSQKKKSIIKKVENRWVEKRNRYESSIGKQEKNINKISLKNNCLKQQNDVDEKQQLRIQPSQQPQHQPSHHQPPSHQYSQSSSNNNSSTLLHIDSPSSQQQDSINPSTLNLKQIYLNFNTINEIQHYIDKIPHQNDLSIQSLQITCDTMRLAVNDKIINRIVMFKKLKKLVICPTYGLKRCHVESIITNLTLLQSLVLEQYYSLDQNLTLLVQNNLHKLKRFYYTTDPRSHLLYKQQNFQFLPTIISGHTNINVINILATIPTLSTITFQNVHKINQIKKIVQKMRQITEISIIFHQQSYNINPIIETLSQLPSIKSILHLQFKQCYFRETALISIIQNCNGLKSFIINKCKNITNLTIKSLKKHNKTLTQIDLMQQNEITGRGFQHFIQLQILSLKSCWQIQEEVLGVNITKLTKLKCLNLNFNNYWVTQTIFSYISILQQLQFLSIDYNKVSLNCLIKIQNLSNLSVLSCGNTQMTNRDFIKFFQSTKSQIKKLNLKRQIHEEKSAKKQIQNKPLSGNLLTQISVFVPFLTHLNIKGMIKVERQHFDNLKNLKCILADIGQLDAQTLSFLKDRQVNIYFGKNHQNYQDNNSGSCCEQNKFRSKDEKLIELEQ